ncbi:phosphoglycerate mutase-like protein [Sistotremastrum niveocremeum HHB9708]|uniref:Phytase A n=1 Tax=Sistotremastrum niveocremeum HHB9708 TaxID=1314777 RepID=A0A164NA99_9AGAM|nr:phosphoglycerate mutase-like protein [Sistotremastrum niveocremeum HHB9708]
MVPLPLDLAVTVLHFVFSFFQATRPAGLDYLPVTTTPDLDLPKHVWHNLAQYAPWFSAGTYPAIPPSCKLTQVNLIERHGARFPTKSAGDKIESTIDKLHRVRKFKDPSLEFLREYAYDLGVEDLVPYGAAQSFDSGQLAAMRYASLVSSDADSIPFLRAAGDERVVDSGTNWTVGFKSTYPTVPIAPPLIIPERNSNNTLSDHMCPNAGDAKDADAQWLSTYSPPILERLNRRAPGADLEAEDVYNLMSMCAFHTVWIQRMSPFCGIFEDEEWELYEYGGDIDKFYKTGYGQRLGPVQGVGWINELIARLTSSPVIDHTQTNRTLDASPLTFPLNRTIYVDFSHDNQMIAIYAAMGLFRQTKFLNTTYPDLDPKRTWITSKLVPFGARMAVERLECSGPVSDLDFGTYVRVLVNDAVQPLEFCGGVNGLCTLQAFLDSQAYARADGEGDFELCYS